MYSAQENCWKISNNDRLTDCGQHPDLKFRKTDCIFVYLHKQRNNKSLLCSCTIAQEDVVDKMMDCDKLTHD